MEDVFVSFDTSNIVQNKLLDIVFENKRVIRNLESLTGLYNTDKSTDFPFEFLLNASDDEWMRYYVIL